MSKSCPIQPKEVTETYAKAGQIYADKVLAIRFDDVMERITEDDAFESRISDYKESFISEMAEASYDPRGYDEQGKFYDKLLDGLSKKFPDVAPDEDAFDDFWVPALKNRFGQYFDDNKKAIAKAIVESRQKGWREENDDSWDGDDDTWEEINEAYKELSVLLPELNKITTDTPPKEVAQRAGIGIGKILLQASGDFILKQAMAASPDIETQKRYFVETLDDWGMADNGYIEDTDAWSAFDSYIEYFETIVDGKKEGGIDDYIDDLSDGSKQAFSDFFNKKTGATSGVPKKGRTPFLLAKKEFQYTAPPPPPTPPQTKPKIELTPKSKQILEEYLKSKNLDVIWDNAENQEQEDAILMETIRLSEERRKA